MSSTGKEMRGTDGPVDEEACLGGAAGQSPVPDAPSAISWTPGAEPPPLTIDHPAAVTLCVRIISGTRVNLPAIVVTEAVAVQIYRLVHDNRVPHELKTFKRESVYVILASLARRVLVAPDAAAAKRLDRVLGRKDDGQGPGLHHALRLMAGKRKGDADMSAMSYDQATNHLSRTHRGGWGIMG